MKNQEYSVQFNLKCHLCPRIADNLVDIRARYPDYHARPVPPFGVSQPALLIVGLGPGMHGANATGRPFTGDYAGILLYKMLYEFGFSNQVESVDRDDGLKLNNCRITNAVKCLPPANKPLPAEIRNCNRYLRAELYALTGKLVILVLGRIAHEAVLAALDLRKSLYPFAHNALHKLDEQRYLLDSYHCSRYNTQTRRLTEPMFSEVFATASRIINE
jgi:uracil-DNA glycosylase family 4